MSPLPSWLETAVFYQIYPQSFYDSNGDGIGDIPGILAKLDYIQSLGINALWLNPCFVSPFQDAGYDVADYYTVAPRYGTNADLKRLFAEAKQRGIRVLLDLVPGHTSLEHPWFKASARHERNPYTDWYIWTNNVWTTPPRALAGCARVRRARRRLHHELFLLSTGAQLRLCPARPRPSLAAASGRPPARRPSALKSGTSSSSGWSKAPADSG